MKSIKFILGAVFEIPIRFKIKNSSINECSSWWYIDVENKAAKEKNIMIQHRIVWIKQKDMLKRDSKAKH